ncbi:Tap42 interacting protein [Recurvomyces mirabilis]|uniref:Tap42 interacting protein n=1 Tax=Recurvomyces mirabilis TaxID=574656 RepID=A0AAE0WFV6_9PEZI|nr:Tap42 interacting protein [Recurvomyces mirabilis]
MASNGSDSGAGTKSYTTQNGTWRITTRKLPILKATPIDQLSNDLGIPIPEMIFGDNLVSIIHLPTAWTLSFNARDALDRVSKTEEGMLQVAVAEEWKKDRKEAMVKDEVKSVVKPFDWSYSTDYRGSTDVGGNPILFFETVDLYEDELADNGIALLSIKIRVMPERLLLLSRFFLRLDGVVVRIRDTRVYIEHGSEKVIRQYTAKEESYAVLQEKLKGMRENAPEAFRDANVLAPLLRTEVDEVEVFEVG